MSGSGLRRVAAALISLPRAVRSEAADWLTALLRAVPGGTGCALRRHFGGSKMGPGSRILENVVVYYGERLTMGANSGISPMTQINAAGGVTIGDNVLIGPGCTIWSQNHRFTSRDVPIDEQGYERSPVVIGDDVWLAAGVIVLPGVTLARGTVVAAGAVVTRSSQDTPYWPACRPGRFRSGSHFIPAIP